MNIFGLKFFKKGDGVCANDFESTEQRENINIDFLISVSDIKNFSLPLSGKHVGKFSTVTMSNNDKYHISEEEHERLNIHILRMSKN